MLVNLKLITPKRFLFYVVAMSLAMAHSGLTAMAESSSSKDSKKTLATSRSTSTTENGKTASISENDHSGITVTVTETVNGQPRQTVTQAANPADLAKKNAAAYELYQKYLGDKASVHASGHALGTPNLGSSKISVLSPTTALANKSGTSANAKAASSASASDDGTGSKGTTTVAPGGNAKEMLRQQLREMKVKNADNPAILKVIDEALRQAEELK